MPPLLGFLLEMLFGLLACVLGTGLFFLGIYLIMPLTFPLALIGGALGVMGFFLFLFGCSLIGDW